MGEAHRKAEARAEMRRRDANTYLAGRSQDVADQRRAQTERQLGLEESLLGTDAQVNGQLGGPDAGVVPFTGRFQFDTSAAGLKVDARSNKTLGQSVNLQQRVDAANALMQQAQDAAEAGNFTLAEQLKAQAQSGLTANTNKEFGELGGMDMSSIFSLVEDPAVAARARLGGPQAQIVGKQLNEARAFQDFNSEASVNERKIMSEAGERSIAAASRDAQRQNRMGAMSGGPATTAYGRQLAEERSARNFGAQRAQLFATVASDFQDMQRKYAKDSVGFAQAFLQNQSGVRESFQSALDQIRSNFSQLAQQTASMNQAMAQFQFQRADQEQARKDARAQRYQDMMLAVAGLSIGGGMGAMGAPSGQRMQGALNGASAMSGSLGGGAGGAAAVPPIPL